MESENNATLIDTLSLILAIFQLLICNLHQHFFFVPDKAGADSGFSEGGGGGAHPDRNSY